MKNIIEQMRLKEERGIPEAEGYSDRGERRGREAGEDFLKQGVYGNVIRKQYSICVLKHLKLLIKNNEK